MSTLPPVMRPIPREKYDKTTLYTLWILSGLTSALIITRLVWRWRIARKYHMDDYWMAFSLFPLLLRLGCIHYALIYFTAYITNPKYRNGGMSTEEIRRRVIGSKTILPGRAFYAGFLWCMKVCILVWFGRITRKTGGYGIAIKFTYFFLGISLLVVLLSTFLECRPINLYWQIYPNPGKCVKATYQLWTTGILNMLVFPTQAY